VITSSDNFQIYTFLCNYFYKVVQNWKIMEISEEKIVKIIENYYLLKDSLRELECCKKEREGVILGYAAHYYISAQKAKEFLEEIPESLKNKLKIGFLEDRLHLFANTHIKL